MDPTDEDLIAFARSMIGDDTEPFLAPEILPKAVAKNRDLSVMLCRVPNGHFEPSSGRSHLRRVATVCSRLAP